MKRSGFKRKTPMRTWRHEPTMQREDKPQAFVMPTVKSLHKATYASSGTVPAPKRVPIRSPKLLAAVRALPCQITGRTGGVEAAHSNWSQHGKARGQKADDNRVAALHHSLHRELDQGSRMSAEERQALWWRAHVGTVLELQRRNQWPPNVPVPQLEDFWKP